MRGALRGTSLDMHQPTKDRLKRNVKSLEPSAPNDSHVLPRAIHWGERGLYFLLRISNGLWEQHEWAINDAVEWFSTHTFRCFSSGWLSDGAFQQGLVLGFIIFLFSYCLYVWVASLFMYMHVGPDPIWPASGSALATTAQSFHYWETYCNNLTVPCTERVLNGVRQGNWQCQHHLWCTSPSLLVAAGPLQGVQCTSSLNVQVQ